ncbi:hypothetical protein BDP27DRAFT_1028852 [Rhodocollybia butyracea]|uniref:Uncharacterized protein n=1 Tax=Rhodocollybia butyracea TaxID=206335 RepID=A0A9P5UCQ2_9AGAR|nr:hypothetical protein BDP27DRAFT_1028852 [Rhodocollybia butyracea]
MEMATLFPSSSAQPPQCTPVHKIRRKPAPSLLSPITPITSLSAPDVESTPAAGQVDTRRLSSTKPLITHSRTMSTSLATDPRYPPPDPNDPFAPLSVLRGRSSNAILSASSHFPRTDVTMTDIDATPTPSFMSPKAARTLGVFRGLPTENQKRRFEQSRNRDSMCSFELYADPPHGDSEDENWTVMTPKKPSTGIRSRTPKTSTPVKPSTAGHYTPHSRQRAISSVLSSPSIDYSNNTFTPAPEAFPPPKLSRDRSESSASSTGTGSYSHSGSTSDSANSTLLTPEGSLPTVSLGSGSGSSNGSQIDISDAYAVTRTLLSSSQTHPYAQSEGHAYSPASRVSSSFRYAYGQNRTQINSPENMEGAGQYLQLVVYPS